MTGAPQLAKGNKHSMETERIRNRCREAAGGGVMGPREVKRNGGGRRQRTCPV